MTCFGNKIATKCHRLFNGYDESTTKLVKPIDWYRNTTQTRILCILSLPPANEVWGKVIFLHLFVILFTGGACVAGGVCGLGGVRGEGGMCGKGGHAWQRGGCVWQRGGMCMVCTPPSTRYCWSMRGRYASYWNAFLFQRI